MNFAVSNFKLTRLNNSNYVKPFRVTYTQDGQHKFWDLVQCHHSVSVIIYNKDKNCLVCVKQFRPGVYLNSIPKTERLDATIDTLKYPTELGLTLEFCSGIVDKDDTLRNIAVDEIKEETGYVVEPEALIKVQSYRSSVGISGDKTTLFYVEVCNEQKKLPGGGIDSELIEVVELTMEELDEINSDTSPLCAAEFLAGLRWFLANIKNEK